MISGQVPKHLVVGARTGFLTAFNQISQNMPYQRISEIIPVTAKATDLVDLGAAPLPVENRGRLQFQEMVEQTIEVKPKSWEITVGVSHNAIQDDQTGMLERKVRSAGENFPYHLNQRVFQILNAGDGSTYSLCYDGQSFFDTDHVDKGGQYTTAQDNAKSLALNLDNFVTVRTAAQKFKNDQGSYAGYMYDLLVVPPDLEYEAGQITSNPNAYDTANNEINPFSGVTSYIVSPELDSTAWYLVASNHAIKPLLVIMRENPNLQSSWFDPDGPEGGMFYFKFYARYEIYYGNWRLAIQGRS